MQPLNQLQLFKGSGPIPYDVNSINGTKGLVPDNRPRLTAGAALQLRVVDDRVFSVGMTTWKCLIDLAIETGHTELFESEDDRSGLRKPGFLYAPLPRLPERAAEYIKSRLLVKGCEQYLSKRSNPRKISVVLGHALTASISIGKEALLVHASDQAGVSITWDLKHCAFPFTDGNAAADSKKARSSISARMKAHLKEVGAQHLLCSKDITELSLALHDLVLKLRALAV